MEVHSLRMEQEEEEVVVVVFALKYSQNPNLKLSCVSKGKSSVR